METVRVSDLTRIVIGVDPTGSTSNECGIVVAGLGTNGDGYVLDDKSLTGSPNEWANAIVDAYIQWGVDRVVAERNYGGDMVESVIMQAALERKVNLSFKFVVATRGKAIRAEPVAALYERLRVHHVGTFPALENEYCNWTPDSGYSPNRLDAAVWALTELMLGYSSVSMDDAPDLLHDYRG